MVGEFKTLVHQQDSLVLQRRPVRDLNHQNQVMSIFTAIDHAVCNNIIGIQNKLSNSYNQLMSAW